MKKGLAGLLAKSFIDSKLTPLIIVASLLLGLFAVVKTPREEEPQIVVPMADVLVSMPGISVKDVEARVTTPMEKLIWEIPGVEYVYSTTMPGQSMIVVRFLVGQDQERAFVRLREKLQSHYDLIPPGASQPIIKPRSIDDVPILALTLHSTDVDPMTLRQLALRVEQAVKSVPDVSETLIIGGQKRELQVSLDLARLRGYGLSIPDLLHALSVSNTQQRGRFAQDEKEVATTTGKSFDSLEEVSSTTIGVSNGSSVRVSDVAEIRDAPEDATHHVFFANGSAKGRTNLENAVTVSVAKRQGVNAIDVVHSVLARVESLEGRVLPSNVELTVTRNYGETSAEKSNDLLLHMGIAVVSVSILIAIALGRKESIVVLTAIPVTLALTLLVFYLYGFTLNRITLFALIFSIGILVDDAIVVVENIVRHIRMKNAGQRDLKSVAVEAVDEVGNPTILATFAVIAAILPMAFVGGLMGPYMRPIPVGASAAMVFSLLIAFMVTPWAAVRILKKGHSGKHNDEKSEEDALTKLYRKIMTPLLRSSRARFSFFAVVFLLFAGSVALIAVKAVTVKMLPFDNKNEFQVIVDMPTGTTLERTTAVTAEIGRAIGGIPEVTDYQIYAGSASPYNFNGLVRHYFNRSAPYQADIQVNLLGKHERKAQSHDIVKRVREHLTTLGKSLGARIKVAEVPPGPPVLQTLVAEVYGADESTRMDVARRVKGIFETTEGVSDIDWYVDDDQDSLRYTIDQEKAALAGLSVSDLTNVLETIQTGTPAGLLHDVTAREDVPIMVRVPRQDRSGTFALEQAGLTTASGDMSTVGEFIHETKDRTDKAIYHKNLLPVIYVTGDVVGRQESPVYAILKMNKALEKLRLPEGVKLNVLTTHLPESTTTPAMKWDGEWHITYEVFRDLGVAFAAVLVLIYILVVAWFQDFKTPLVIMAPIPLTLVGILPAHAMMGAFFTATSMIGFIAGAGIIVRNSIILVDFVELRRKQGYNLEDAVIDAGAVRFRPMLLTAAAVIVGSFVILFDPIFQGLAIALMAGEIASTFLSRLTVPILYFLAERRASETQGLAQPQEA